MTSKRRKSNRVPASEEYKTGMAEVISINANGAITLGGRARALANHYRRAYAIARKTAKLNNDRYGRYTPPHGKKHQQILAKAQEKND